MPLPKAADPPAGSSSLAPQRRTTALPRSPLQNERLGPGLSPAQHQSRAGQARQPCHPGAAGQARAPAEDGGSQPANTGPRPPLPGGGKWDHGGAPRVASGFQGSYDRTSRRTAAKGREQLCQSAPGQSGSGALATKRRQPLSRARSGVFGPQRQSTPRRHMPASSCRHRAGLASSLPWGGRTEEPTPCHGDGAGPAPAPLF